MTLEEIVKKDLRKSFNEEQLKNALSMIHFYYGDGTHEPGIYLYEEDDQYHYVEVGDRGGIETHIESQQVEAVLYPLYSCVTFNEATRYELQHREKDEDPRRIIFATQLDYLRVIGEEYYDRRLREIEEILKDYPYSE